MAAPNNILPLADDTIHALSSGAPPAAIAIVRLSGPAAGRILDALAGERPEPRRASLRTLRDRHGDMLDRALTLWFPGPNTATGEDLAEFHLHGGRAVVDAVLSALTEEGSRLAQPGEFTRRSLLNNRLDLGEVEGLADLLAAETEYQRRESLRRSEGALGRQLSGWAEQLVSIAAGYEASIDYDGDLESEDTAALAGSVRALADTIANSLRRVSAERLRDGLRVVITGPVNAGKSSLFNALVGSDAAIVSDIAGTTRDLVERPISIDGMPFVLIDSAGLREATDEVERIGVARARTARETADIIIDLEGSKSSKANVICVTAKSDVDSPRPGTIPTSASTGAGMDELFAAISKIGSTLLPAHGEVAFNRGYREGLHNVLSDLETAADVEDMIIAADHLRHARETLDRLTGASGFEDMLDALFGRFCLGK